MSDFAIRVEGLSKRYRIGGKPDQYKTLRDTLVEMAGAPVRSLSPKSRRAGRKHPDGDGIIWALEEVSFEVKRGEVVGVIGRNGAGKSTLLKILSRITEPTRGYADIQGRVGSLLEVGTGFHQELTGRENVYLNGAIIGMKKAEIDRKFDEIVAFAEVEKFIDTPVKHYSSGMYLRLAFSVAAHLEPEILLIDEVLAVGDMAFQRKCLGKMGDVAAHGRTVLFVSHNLGAIKELCTTGIVLKDGRLEFRGPVVEGLARYSRCLTDDAEGLSVRGGGWRRVLIINGRSDGIATTVEGGEPLVSEALLELGDEFAGARLFCIINNSVGDTVVHQRVDSRELTPARLEAGRYRVRVELPPLWLAPGIYTLYFKFIGGKPTGTEERHFSERVILDVTGKVNGISRANLAPPLRWALAHESARGREGSRV